MELQEEITLAQIVERAVREVLSDCDDYYEWWAIDVRNRFVDIMESPNES